MLFDFVPRLKEVNRPVAIAVPHAIHENRGSFASIILEATVIESTIPIKPRDMWRNLSIFEPRYQTMTARDISLGTALPDSPTISSIMPCHLLLIMNVFIEQCRGHISFQSWFLRNILLPIDTSFLHRLDKIPWGLLRRCDGAAGAGQAHSCGEDGENLETGWIR